MTLRKESYVQGRHGEFEPGKAQYSTPNFLTGCYLYYNLRAYWNPESRQGPGLGGLASRGGPELYLELVSQQTCLRSFAIHSNRLYITDNIMIVLTTSSIEWGQIIYHFHINFQSLLWKYLVYLLMLNKQVGIVE